MMAQQLDLIPRWAGTMGNKKITTSYRPTQGTWILLIDGRESFFNPMHEMREWPTEDAAIQWFEVHYNGK